ncbi:MAG: Tim44-like domain-containing protein [Casimicrobiaceae bacterium]|nr:Tim44-like domain-containing protein [Casimicrobiaceae bacterium]
MWKMLSLFVVALTLVVSAAVEAKRLGGGKSVGVQREAPAVTRPAPPAKATPTREQAAPNATGAANAAAQAAAPSGMARWAGPLAAIAAGLGLGFLFAQLGATGFLIVLLAALATFAAFGFLAWRVLRPQAAAVGGGAQPSGGGAPSAFERQPGLRFSPLGPSESAGVGVAVPAGFDKAGFEAEARRQFLALQAANDRGDLDAVRELVTDELYNEIARDVVNGNREPTEFDRLEVELLSIETDRGMYWARVAFSGTVREEGVVMGSPFHEIWNLNKPVDGSRGWLLAGIEQA